MNLNVYEYAWPSLIRPVRHSASSPNALSMPSPPYPCYPTLLFPLPISIYLTACASLIRPVRRTACTFPLCICVSLPAPRLCLASSLAPSLPSLLLALLLFIFVSFAVVGNSKSSVAAAVALPQQMATAALDQAAFFSSLSLSPPSSVLSPSPPFSEFLWPSKTIKSSELLMR